jgi:hypothetical protein
MSTEATKYSLIVLEELIYSKCLLSMRIRKIMPRKPVGKPGSDRYFSTEYCFTGNPRKVDTEKLPEICDRPLRIPVHLY